MPQPEQFTVVGIPLSRPEIVAFLQPEGAQPATPQGARLRTIGQRPTPQAEAGRVARLENSSAPTVADFLAIEDPHNNLIETYTDRLVPVESLAQDEFLTRDLGGWVANFFGVIGLPQPWPNDPLLNHAEILTEYGPRIRYFGADPAMVAGRLEQELGGDLAAVVQALARLHALRRQAGNEPRSYIERLYDEIASQSYFAGSAGSGQPPIPDALLLDELAGQLVRLELRRREALARHEHEVAGAIGAWQEARQEATGMRLILQGEYIVGRHRRSTVLIAPSLGVVVKQPAPEPFHDIALGAKTVMGRPENWPVTVNGGEVVTAWGRIRLTLEENLVPRLNRIFGHHVRFVSSLGLTIEPFIEGKTVMELVLEDHDRLTPELYETIILHQQVCEVLKVDNNDWHAPNFVRRDSDGAIVHIDWGAVRPLEEDEFTPEHIEARLTQVSNMAYSFRDQNLADRLAAIHTDLVTNPERMGRLRRQAEALVAGAYAST